MVLLVRTEGINLAPADTTFQPTAEAQDDAELACRILVIEDERHIARLLDHILTKEGYEVEVAHDAESALETIESFRPHALLLDIGLPGISGLDFLRQIRLDSRWARLVVLVLSAHWFEHDDPSIADAGATAQCPKPIAPSKLLRKLRECGISPSLVDSRLSVREI
jgi:DNA-binding response OmpR family regulator